MIEKWIYYSHNPKLTRKQLNSLSEEELQQKLDSSKYEQIKNYIEKQNIGVLYPDQFHHYNITIPQTPKILYYCWDILLLYKARLWIIWPRKPSEYGVWICNYLIKEWSWYDIVTISWAAPGIDQLCHINSIQNNIKTIAILWWWIGYYLQKETQLMNDIIKNGWLVISEYKLFSKPERYTFPQRNRIISWLSDYLFIIEAWEHSGSLITVDIHHKSGKKAFAVPWNIFKEQSKWLHTYINAGKIEITLDIPWFLQAYFTNNKKNIIPNINYSPYNIDHLEINDIEKRIILFCKDNPKNIKQLWELLNVDTQAILSKISILEIQWLIEEKSVGYYKSTI